MRLPNPKDDDEVILYVADWLLFEQQKPSFIEAEIGTDGSPVSTFCAYRGGDVNSGHPCACALGCLIPDDEYDEEFEATALADFTQPDGGNEVSKYFYAREFYIPLLIKLQSVHDLSLARDEDNVLHLWWRNLVKLTYNLGRDRNRSPCHDKESLNADSFKDTSFKILKWPVPGVTPEDVRRLAEECQRQR